MAANKDHIEATVQGHRLTFDTLTRLNYVLLLLLLLLWIVLLFLLSSIVSCSYSDFGVLVLK